ncbi:polysaccharide deacetylase family protein, partial [Bacillus sp. SIMBA_161]
DAASSNYVTKGNTASKVVALTFDDGADGTNINKILNTLDSHNVKATFFLTGSGINHHPGWIRNIANAGHQVGNHSYSHP